MAVYYSLPRVKLNNLLSNFDKSFYKSWAEEIDDAVDSYFQRKALSEAPSEDIKNYLLVPTEYSQELQSDIDLCITRDRFKPSWFSKKIGSNSKKCHQKPEQPRACF